MLKISKRLAFLSEMVTEGNVLADVGTDHGYIPIYLLQQKKIPKAIAMDIGKEPLKRAKEHIEEYGLGGYIETRLSDGLTALKEGEADTILAAGMGGSLILRILTEGYAVAFSGKELILQPQSDIFKVRQYLYQNGYEIIRENMVFEDGKYYQMFACGCCRNEALKSASVDPVWCRYGKLLLMERHPVLKEYLIFMKNQYENILGNLSAQPQKAAITRRIEQIESELAYISKALLYWR